MSRGELCRLSPVAMNPRDEPPPGFVPTVRELPPLWRISRAVRPPSAHRSIAARWLGSTRMVLAPFLKARAMLGQGWARAKLDCPQSGLSTKEEDRGMPQRHEPARHQNG